MRDHNPIPIEEFNGWWQRGDIDSCPPDHFTESINLRYLQSGFDTRYGVEQLANKQNIVRAFPFNTNSDGYLGLDSNGKIYHFILSSTITEILSIPGMTDFKMININNRAYITPLVNGGGMTGQFVYVYNNDGNTARKAAGIGPVNADGALAVAAGAAGNIEAGIHIFGVVYETNSGFLTQIGPDTLPTLNASGTTKANLTAVPVSPSAVVVARHVVATKLIDPALYTGDTRGYQFFFVPSGEIPNNTGTTITVNFFDSELIDDASHLLDILSEIPASNGLSIYHNRMVSYGQFGDNSIVRVSEVNEPEAMNAVDGVLFVIDNGLGLLQAQEYRDILYLYKINFTIGFSDNGDVPSSWPSTIIDEGVGCAVQGICTVGIYQGGINLEYIISFDFSGIYIFDGIFRRPELSWKIRDYWTSLTRIPNVAQKNQIVNDPLNQYIYISLFTNTILVGDYSQGLDFQKIKWSKWTFDETVNSILLMDKDNKLLIVTNSYIYYIKTGNTSDEWSSGTTKIPNPTAISALFPGDDEEDLTHFGATRIRVNGSGVLRQKLYGLDGVETFVLGNTIMATSPGNQPTQLANLINQRARLELQTTGINETMRINRVIIFIKPVYTSLPG